jgi:hypothetical protein
MTDKAGAYGPVATMPRTGQLGLRRGFSCEIRHCSQTTPWC